MSKFLRDLTKIAEEEGYEYAGYAGSESSGPGSGHHVFIHTASGAVMRTASTPKSESNSLKYARASFRNQAKRANSKAAIFRAWLLKRYKVGRAGSKVVEFKQPELVEQFNAEHPELQPMNTGHLTVMMGQDPMFERIDSRTVGKNDYITVMKIMGPAYGLTKEGETETPTIAEDPCGATFLTPDQGIAVCVKEKGHEGLHYDSFRKTRWADGAGVPVAEQREPEPVIDPVAAKAKLPKLDEQIDEMVERRVAERLAQVGPTQTPSPAVLEPVVIDGVAIPESLADQLREALGMPEAAIAAEAQDLAVKALQDAEAALSVAMKMIQGVPVVKAAKRQRGEDVNFTTRSKDRLAAIVVAIQEGRLPERFTVTEVQDLLGLSVGQTTSMLAKANRVGDTFRRVAPNTYEVA